jgi:hypothetical protein
VKMWFVYSAEMTRLEARRAEAARATAARDEPRATDHG